MQDIETILNERDATHGDFERTSQIAQCLKNTIRMHTHSVHKGSTHGALDMICTKLARITCGNADEPDHWRDIARYAELVLRELENKDA